MDTIDQYAVFGDPIGHSKSPKIHSLFAQQTEQRLNYTAQRVPLAEFESCARQFFEQGGLGLNCTVPLKEVAWQFADQLSERARLSKAVNTLKKLPDGRIFGDNTDGVGLIRDLTLNHALTLHHKSILVLGAGGATRGIIGPILEQAPQRLVIANRSIDKALRLSDEFSHDQLSACGFEELSGQCFDLIFNATSASLSGDLPDLPEQLLAEQGSCYDLAYANTATTFVVWGNQQHALLSLDGVGMLVEQAAEAFYLWRGIRPETQPVIAWLNSQRG